MNNTPRPDLDGTRSIVPGKLRRQGAGVAGCIGVKEIAEVEAGSRNLRSVRNRRKESQVEQKQVIRAGRQLLEDATWDGHLAIAASGRAVGCAKQSRAGVARTDVGIHFTGGIGTGPRGSDRVRLAKVAARESQIRHVEQLRNGQV